MTSARNIVAHNRTNFSANIFFVHFFCRRFDKVFWARTVFTSLIFPKAHSIGSVEKGELNVRTRSLSANQPSSIGFDDQYEAANTVSVNEQTSERVSERVNEWANELKKKEHNEYDCTV